MKLIPLTHITDTRKEFMIDVVSQGYTRDHATHLARILYPVRSDTRATTTRRTTQGNKKTAKNGRVKK